MMRLARGSGWILVLGLLGCGPELTRPIPIVPPRPIYTRQAREEKIEGRIVVKCTITKEGLPTNCRIIEGLLHMNEAVLDALAKARYKPSTYNGKAIDVEYVWHFNLKLE